MSLTGVVVQSKHALSTKEGSTCAKVGFRKACDHFKLRTGHHARTRKPTSGFRRKEYCTVGNHNLQLQQYHTVSVQYQVKPSEHTYGTLRYHTVRVATGFRNGKVTIRMGQFLASLHVRGRSRYYTIYRLKYTIESKGTDIVLVL